MEEEINKYFVDLRKDIEMVKERVKKLEEEKEEFSLKKRNL